MGKSVVFKKGDKVTSKLKKFKDKVLTVQAYDSSREFLGYNSWGSRKYTYRPAVMIEGKWYRAANFKLATAAETNGTMFIVMLKNAAKPTKAGHYGYNESYAFDHEPTSSDITSIMNEDEVKNYVILKVTSVADIKSSGVTITWR